MTPEIFFLILAIIIAITICAVFNSIFGKSDRDYALQCRDRGMAKLYEARAELLHTESLERRRVLTDLANRRRDQVCDDVRDARGSSS